MYLEQIQQIQSDSDSEIKADSVRFTFRADSEIKADSLLGEKQIHFEINT